MQGNVVLITGAGRGIGAAAGRVFAAAGAKVALLGRREGDVGRLAAEIGAAARPVVCDVADAGALRAAVQGVIDWGGRLDVLINNAGVIDPIARLADADPEAVSRAVDVNLKAVFWGMQAVLPQMHAQGGGTVLTLSSGAASSPVEGWAAYCSSKAGAQMLTRVLHHEEAGAGIRAMGLSPGTVATGMQEAIRDSGINPVSGLDWSAHIPPEWVARTLLWMCGPGADAWLGTEISLRDEGIRRQVGLIA